MGILLGSGGLLDFFLTLGQDELDVARVGHVGVDLVECQLCDSFSFFGSGVMSHTRP